MFPEKKKRNLSGNIYCYRKMDLIFGISMVLIEFYVKLENIKGCTWSLGRIQEFGTRGGPSEGYSITKPGAALNPPQNRILYRIWDTFWPRGAISASEPNFVSDLGHFFWPMGTILVHGGGLVLIEGRILHLKGRLMFQGHYAAMRGGRRPPQGEGAAPPPPWGLRGRRPPPPPPLYPTLSGVVWCRKLAVLT